VHLAEVQVLQGAEVTDEIVQDPTEAPITVQPDWLKVPKQARFTNFGDFEATRLIAIGDIHGCVEEMFELVQKLDLQEHDILVFLGDYVDRGPASAAVVQAVRYWVENRPQTYAILGNHDEKVARYRRHLLMKRDNPAYKIPMKTKGDRAEEWAKLSDGDCQWIAELPAVAFFRGHYSGRGVRIFTHAGLIDGLDIRQPTDGLIRNRYLMQKEIIHNGRPTGAMGWVPAPLGAGHAQPPGSILWDEIWSGAPVIYGHIVHDLEKPRIYSPNTGGASTVGIDTGCCFGGHLTAYVEELKSGTITFVQVKAKAEYEPRDKDKEGI
jgi:diadenosine tetraphosphatase ApaH/serine/threonine PP2A family protein phosphatase